MYARVHKVRGRNGQTYSYLELVVAGRPNSGEDQVCSLGRIDDLIASGSVHRITERLAQITAAHSAGREPVGDLPNGEDLSRVTVAVQPKEGGVGEKMVGLKGSPLFVDVTDEELFELAELAAMRYARAGQFIFTEGDLLEYLYLVVEGRVKILMHSPSGKDFVMAFSGPGEIIGNAALYSARAHANSAQAVLDAKLLAIRNDDFLSFLSRKPELGFRILRRLLVVVGIRLMGAMRRLTDLAAEKAENRLAYVLFTLSLEFGLTLPFTREEVAQMAGTTTETAVRFISSLKKLGILGPARRKVVILDQDMLRSFIRDSQQSSDKG